MPNARNWMYLHKMQAQGRTVPNVTTGEAGIATREDVTLAGSKGQPASPPTNSEAGIQAAGAAEGSNP